MNQAPFAPIYELFLNLYQNIKKHMYIVDGGHDKFIKIITKKNKKYILVISILDIVKIINNEKIYMQSISFTQTIKLHKKEDKSDFNVIKWFLFDKYNQNFIT